jgi:hypothetical protein
VVARESLIPAYEDNPDLWEDVVGASDAFANNPKSGWKDILILEGTLNVLSHALMSIVGAACFGLSEADTNRFEYYRQQRKHSLETRMGFFSDVVSIANSDSGDAFELLALVKRDAEPLWERQNSFFADLEGAILAGRPVEPFADRWRELANEYNSAFLKVIEKYKIYSS